MIDITNEILTKLKNELSGVSVKSSYDGVNPKFPLVTINETDNMLNPQHVSSNYCNTFTISFDINIFDIGNKKETSVKSIRNKIDDIMLNHYKMNRVSSQNIENYLDNEIYRWVLRYSCVVDKDLKIYRG